MALVDETLWRRISPLLDQAIELLAEQREELIASVRADDPETAEALERHLAAHDRALASGFLAPPTGGGDPLSLAGQVLGAYTLVERLGAGGMGSVWRARRSDGQFEGDVAVKLLHPSLFEGEGAERFRREGSILSRLTHPGIARLYDAGLSNAGQPYLVLELVEGTRIDRFADERRLSVRERLALLLQVSESVAHAHASLVVHRDLKPSNILVDNEGRVKLLDFGVAALLDSGTGEARGRTVTAATALTPEYAAPEQLEGGAITTATDVYALGVLLYELLTGRHPVAEPDISTAELVRAITTQDPPRMSDRARGLGERANEAAVARSTTPERLSRQLAGDLDTIVGKALKKASDERYPSVTALADDLQRHLNDLPVRARRDSFGYRLRKLVVRHRLETVMAGVALAALLGSTAIAWRQARASALERDRALEELQRAEITNDLSAFLLSDAAPAGDPISRAELLRRGEQMIAGRFADNPSLQAHMLLVLSERYYEAFDVAGWERVLRDAYELSRRTSDARLRAVVACELAVVELERDGDRAQLLLAEGTAGLARAPGASAELARCHVAEAIVARRRGELERSLVAAEAAVAFERARPGPPGRGVNALNTLALTQADLGLFEAAGRSYEALFSIFEAQGRGRTKTASFLHMNWAVALLSAGQIRHAVAESETAVVLARELDPEAGASPNMLSAFGSALSFAGRIPEASVAIDEALAKARQSKAAVTQFWVTCIASRVRAEADDHAGARALLSEVDRLVTDNATFPPWFAATIDRYRAHAALEEGDLARAIAVGERALEALELHARPVREILPTLLTLARAANDSSGHATARLRAERALELARERLGGFSHSREVGLAELELARAAAGLGEPARARESYGRALENLVAAVGEQAPETRRAREAAARFRPAS